MSDRFVLSLCMYILIFLFFIFCGVLPRLICTCTAFLFLLLLFFLLFFGVIFLLVEMKSCIMLAFLFVCVGVMVCVASQSLLNVTVVSS